MKLSDISSTEYHPYFQGYISLAPDLSLEEALSNGLEQSAAFYASIPEDKLEYRYAEGKWSVKEIIQHLIDSERMFCFRALSFARSENANLPGFDENEFTANSNADKKSLDSLLEEYKAVRAATIHMFRGMEEATLKSTGMANGNTLSTRAAGFLICGHEIHHRNIITERYL